MAKQQSSYQRKCKENLGLSSAAILLDFSENYTFCFQDEVQDYHWSHNSSSVHPAVCCYMDSNGKK